MMETPFVNINPSNAEATAGTHDNTFLKTSKPCHVGLLEISR